MKQDDAGDKQDEKKISIHIDKKQFFAPKPEMTGAELKTLGGIGAGYDLFKEMHGQRDDVKIGDSEKVQLKNGDHFYSVPQSLNPGAGNASA